MRGVKIKNLENLRIVERRGGRKALADSNGDGGLGE